MMGARLALSAASAMRAATASARSGEASSSGVHIKLPAESSARTAITRYHSGIANSESAMFAAGGCTA